MTLLTFESVHFSHDEQEVLRNITCQFTSGEMIGLIGPNGAGKSTLLQLMMANLKPNKGTIQLHQKAVASFSKQKLAQQISLVPQDTDIGYAFTVEEIVAMGRNPHLGRFQPASQEDQNIIYDALKRTDLDAMAKRFVNTLSGGERQRVLIARAIAQQTAIVLFDEATANLDICHQLDIMELAKGLAQKGRLVICAIHDLNMAARYCDRILLLADNKLQSDNIPDKVLTEENLRKYFSIDARIHSQSLNTNNHIQITPIQSLHQTP